MKFVLALVFAAILTLGQGKPSFEEDFVEELYNGECFCCKGRYIGRHRRILHSNYTLFLSSRLCSKM